MKRFLPLLSLFAFSYSSAQQQQWINQFNGTGNGMDAVKAMTVDPSGNVYVTGYAFNGTNDNDYVTIKYNSAGAQQWLAKYNGPGSGSDIPSSLFVDAKGNVYVTGSSDALTGNFINNDVATVKYNAAGTQVWVARYDGALQRADAGNAVKADAAGNVFITGYTTVKPLGIKKNYLTIKYNSNGVQQWLQTYQGPGRTNSQDDQAIGLALDAQSNVYVTGSVFTGAGYLGRQDYLTIKYNNAGVQQWTAQYNGPANSFDIPTAIAADNAGNVVVTGYSSGNDLDFATIKYNTNGVQQWLARYNGPANSADLPYALTLDNAGNVYVTGSDQKTIYNSDYLTVKYNSAGAVQWTARYNGNANDNDEAQAIAVDRNGNVFVTGYINGTSPSWNMATVKYSASGMQQWATTFDGGKDSADVGSAIGVDTLGNVYVSGAATGKKSAWDFNTIKYKSSSSAQATGSLSSAQQNSITTEIIPGSFSLQNYPNPFTAFTVVHFVLPAGSGEPAVAIRAQISVYAMSGKLVAILADEHFLPGEHRIPWNPQNLSAGIYYVRFSSANFHSVKPMLKQNN